MSSSRKGTAGDLSSRNDLTNWELTALACFLEGGATRRVHTEDLAVRAFALAPGRFAWSRYQDRIDLDAVRVSLTDAAKAKNGPLIIGSKDDGWMLTAPGLAWTETLEKSEPGLFAGSSGFVDDQRRAMAQSIGRETARLMASAAYMKWKVGELNGITAYDFFEATRTSEYLPPRQMQLRRSQLEGLVKDDPELASFVKAIFDRFGSSYRSGLEGE